MKINKRTSSTGLQVNNSAPSRPATPLPADSPEPKATLQSKQRPRTQRFSLNVFFRPRVEARRSLDPSVASRVNGARGSEQFDLNKTLDELGLGFGHAGDKEPRSKWDAQRKASSGRPSDKIQGEPRQRAESGASTLPPADTPPALPNPQQAASPEKAGDETLSKPGQPAESGALNRTLPNDLPALPSPPPPLKFRPLPPLPPKDGLSKVLSPLAEGQPWEEPPASALDISVGPLPPQPADVPVNKALTFLDVNPSDLKKSAFTEMSKMLNVAHDATAELKDEVNKAKTGLEQAKTRLKSAKKPELNTAKKELNVAEARLRDAETRCKVRAKCLHDFYAGKLEMSAVQRAVTDATKLVQTYEGAQQKALYNGGDKDVADTLKMIDTMLEHARADLLTAQSQQKIAQWSQDVLVNVPAALHSLVDVLGKMNSAASDRGAWVKLVSKDLTSLEMQTLQYVTLAPGGQIGARLQLMLDGLVKAATRDDKTLLQGAQGDIRSYSVSVLKTIEDALAVLSKLPRSLEAEELRNDLQRLREVLQDPKGGPQQLLLIGQADPEQVMRLAQQLWVPPPADLPPPLPPHALAPPTT